jgi:hypothetical protein
MDTNPLIEGRCEADIVASGHVTGAPGWCDFWEAYRKCQLQNGITLDPSRISSYVRGTSLFDQVVAVYYDMPIGSYPKGQPENFTFGSAAA